MVLKVSHGARSRVNPPNGGVDRRLPSRVAWNMASPTDDAHARDAFIRLRDEIRRADSGLRPALTAAELDAFAREIRPDAEARIEIQRLEGEPMVVVRAVKRVREVRPPGGRLAALTPREREVASLIARGLTNAEIARELGIGFATVKDHVHNILGRLGVRSRQAIVAAVVGERASAPGP
jgi:DNA-binding CsgD family transcriptional regulator